MEELFFAGLIGNVQIDSIIPYILRMETAEYSNQMGSMDSSPSPSTTASEPNYQEPTPAFVISPMVSAHPHDGILSIDGMETHHDIAVVSQES
jgi:predicted cobalt transporter CbtA